MNGKDIIQGTVLRSNVIQYSGRQLQCWKNSMSAAVVPEPLDLSEHEGQVVELIGRLHGDLWDAEFVKVVLEDGYQVITGKVTGINVIKGSGGPIYCYRHGMVESWYMILSLVEYFGKTIQVSGDLHDNKLYNASVVSGPEKTIDNDPDKEARSLNDLLKIREANRDKIEAVNGNLGTALGYKWTNSVRTDHPCVIIFVPQKALPWLVPDDQKAPEILETPEGLWCLTDVVTGGSAASLDEIEVPPISPENQMVVNDLKSGRVGLIGGIQLAFFEDGIQNQFHSGIGTAGIAVKHTHTHEIGFLTNQHVADAPGRQIYHPWHHYFHIGTTMHTRTYEPDQDWYNGVVDETRSYVRCDCGFVAVANHLKDYVQPGLHAIGTTGDLLRISPDTMDIIGQKVISVGRTRGVQRGTIVAFAYEFNDEYYSIYTDLLIIGEDGNAFSWKGDSGKIIVTDDAEHRPVALLWGGWQERLRKGREQEIWSYAIDLGKVLDLMNLDLLE
jgi:hypothetical protein